MQAANYYIQSCSGSTSGVVDFGFLTPSFGNVYALIFVNQVLPDGCYTVISADTTPIDVIYDFQLFPNCNECVNGVPVNEFYEYVGFCCESGVTSNGAAYPHPEYGSGLGVAVQLNAVELGGFNGLNN
jgi:hypothetical protein